jgi:hypothetical protein
VDKGLRDLLAEIVRQQAQRGPLPSAPQSYAMSQMVLNPYVSPQTADDTLRKDIRGPSPVNRIIDVLSRPLYAVANPIKETVETIRQENPENLGELFSAGLKNPPSYNYGAAWEGFTGREKTTGADILEASGERSGAAKGILGFALDLGLDPLTYTGVGSARSILGAGTKKSIGALRGVEEGTGAAAQSVTEEISRRAAQQVKEVPPVVPTGAPPAPSIPLRGQVQEPARTFAAGPGPSVPDLTRGALPVGPLGSARTMAGIDVPTPVPKNITDPVLRELLEGITTKQQSLPIPLPKNFVPLDANAISVIKQGVARGLPLEQAALRPLQPVEREILQRGIQGEKSSRQLERELSQATGRAPERIFSGPAASTARQLGPEEAQKVAALEAQRDEILAKIDDLEMQTSGTSSSEVLANEISRLEARLQQIAPESTRLKNIINSSTDPAERGRIAQQLEDLNNEREQLLQQTAAISEEGLEAGTLGPAGVTRTIINQEINKLERQARRIGGEIENLKKPPEVTQVQSTPTQAKVTPGDTIATPAPKRPETVQNLLDEVSGIGRNWQNMVKKQLGYIPPGASRIDMITILEAQKAANRSPVFRNMINLQIRKLREGVTPASLVQAAAERAVPFPAKSISKTRRAAAEKIAKDFLKANTFEEINHTGQTNLFNRIQSWANKNLPPKARASEVYQMLRVAEDSILASGKKLVDAEGLTVRLTDIATLAGGAKSLTTRLVDDFRHARPVQAVEDAKAGASTAVANEVLDPVVQSASKLADSVSGLRLPPSRTVQIGNELTRELSKLARQAGASAKEAGEAKKFMEDFFNPARDDLYSEVMQEARQLVRQSMSGKVDAHTINRINKKVYDSLQGNPKVLGGQATQGRVVEAIMTRFATWWNAKDLRPFAREYIDTARNVAAAFERSMTPLVRATTPTQRMNAWRVAQGKVTAGSAAEKELADRFQYLVENLVGAHDLVDTPAVAESVLIRSGTTMRELNKDLPKRLQFKDTRGADDLGRSYDYSDGKWMHSWKEWDIDEPAEALYQLTRSLQLVTRKNAMLDDAAARWGVPVRGGDFTHTVNADRLQNFYFPKQIADQLNTVWKRLETDKFYYGGKPLQIFDKVQRMWKTGVTIYSPSHHIRNLNGDIFLSALDGVVTPGPYLKSMQVMHAYKGRYSDIESVLNIMDKDLRDRALRAAPGSHIVTTRAGHSMTAEQVYQAAESQGFLLRATTLEDIINTGTGMEGTFGALGQKFAPFGGRVHQTAAKTSELRDHFVRIAHFIDVLGKSKQKTLRDAIEEAGHRVKKFHPDGSDLTGFEQSVMRRIIPFYSWLRKSTPLLIEGAVMRPHISLAFPKAMANIQQMTGVESNGPGDPFPMDQMFPDWIKEKGIGPIIDPESPLAGIGRQQTWRGETPGYVVVDPTNPLTDMLAEFTDPRQALMSNLTPAARIPGELLTGHTALGIPIEEVEGGTTGHILQQVPPLGIGARVTGMTRPEEPWHPEQLTNWLTSAGIKGTGPYEAQAQFEIRDAIAAMGRRERESRK